ncbi:MAG: cysteine synthase family protein [Patescibacteria group bacterium]
MKYAENILDLVGNTPLVKITKLNPNPKVTILAKLEYFNPGGSMKDRMAVAMVEDAEKKGLLKKGGIIVEPTSGNTGAGLAMIAAIRGYTLIAVMTEKVSLEKELVLRAYGAEVVRTRMDVDHTHPEYYVNVAKKIAQEKDAFMPDQYNNPANPLAYYQTAGPEIWRDTEGKITHFVATIGTGGSISGIAQYLKEKNPKVQIIGVDADGSMLHHYFNHTDGEPHPYKVEGPGKDFIPNSLAIQYIDKVMVVNDAHAFATARELAREEGILAGGSSGMALFAAKQVAKQLPKDATIVVLLPDSGKGYVSTFYNDRWMRENKFL